MDVSSAGAQASTPDVEGGLGDVEDRDVAEAAGVECVDQGGRPTADVDDGRVGGHAKRSDEFDRGVGLGLVPAELVGFLVVDAVPMPPVLFGNASGSHVDDYSIDL